MSCNNLYSKALAQEFEEPQPWRMELHGDIHSPNRSPILNTRGEMCTNRDMYNTTGFHLSWLACYVSFTLSEESKNFSKFQKVSTQCFPSKQATSQNVS